MTIRQSPDTTDPAVTNRSGLGYNLGATLSISSVIGLAYAAIATNVDHATQPTFAAISLWAGIVIVTTVVLTALRHFVANGANRGDMLWMLIVVTLAPVIAFPMFVFLMPFAAFFGHMLDRELGARSKSKR